jgi:acyl carrier protein
MNQTHFTRGDISEFVMGKVKELLYTEESLSLNEELANQGLDSFISMHLVIEFETRFEIVFDDEELLFENFATVQDMVNRICLKLEIV